MKIATYCTHCTYWYSPVTTAECVWPSAADTICSLLSGSVTTHVNRFTSATLPLSSSDSSSPSLLYLTHTTQCYTTQERELLWEKEAFNKKRGLMRGSLSLHLKKHTVKAFVWSVALYGSKTWKVDIRRLEAFEIWIWRWMLKVP